MTSSGKNPFQIWVENKNYLKYIERLAHLGLKMRGEKLIYM
jgi:hypothetical protein